MAAPGKRGLETAEEVPAKLSALNVAKIKLSSFLQWCKERKFNVSPKVSSCQSEWTKLDEYGTYFCFTTKTCGASASATNVSLSA